jgi:hypothetical protein
VAHKQLSFELSQFGFGLANFRPAKEITSKNSCKKRGTKDNRVDYNIKRKRKRHCNNLFKVLKAEQAFPGTVLR